MNRTLKLTSIALMTALSIVANIFTVQLSPNNAISFTITICLLTGIYFGALPAAIVGYCGDLIAHLIHPMGAYNWFMALSITLYGVLCALVYKIRLPKIVKLIITLALVFVICLCALNTFGLWLQYIVGQKPSIIGLVQYFGMDKGGIKKSFWVYLAGRAPISAINVAVNGVIVAVLQQTKVVDKLFVSINNKIANGTDTEKRSEEITSQNNDEK